MRSYTTKVTVIEGLKLGDYVPITATKSFITHLQRKSNCVKER